MEAFTTVTGAAAPLMMTNVDTDVIIRIERLTSLPKDALGPFAFEALRYRDADGGGDLVEDPGFVLNRPPFTGAPILLADDNFGCGSSREGAVWALRAMGFRCVIAPGFGEIFASNCAQNGMLAIRLPHDTVVAFATQAADGAAFTVDLVERCVVAPDGTRTTFEIEPLVRESLLAGLDAIGLTLRDRPAIDAWEAADRAARPWNWPDPSSHPRETRA